jgi:hypothetical protein
MIAAFIAEVRFALNRDLLIRGIRKGKDWFSVFNAVDWISTHGNAGWTTFCECFGSSLLVFS